MNNLFQQGVFGQAVEFRPLRVMGQGKERLVDRPQSAQPIQPTRLSPSTDRFQWTVSRLCSIMGRFSMNEIVKEWLQKAEGDFRVAGRELNEAREPDYDAICFHAQQCIEKLIKAILIDKGRIPSKLHDLNVLSHAISEVNAGWDWVSEELRFLTMCAVSFRYPGESAELDDAKKAYEICTRLREKLLALLE